MKKGEERKGHQGQFTRTIFYRGVPDEILEALKPILKNDQQNHFFVIKTLQIQSRIKK